MASSSSAFPVWGSRGAWAVGVLLLIGSSGCWTGRLVESARLRESVVVYTGAVLGDETLRLDYRSEIRDASARPVARRERSASVALAVLSHDPELPVDEVPVRLLGATSRDDEGTPLPLLLDGSADPETRSAAAAGAAMVVEVEVREGRHTAVRLCPVSGGRCAADFHSGALSRDQLAWWVYPVAPLTVAVDLALLPLQAVTWPPMLLLGD